MSNHILEIKNKSEYELEEKLNNYFEDHGIESLERIFGRAVSDYYDAQFQSLFDAKKLPESSLDQFKEDAEGTIKYDHPQLFETEDGGKILVNQPLEVNVDMLESYQSFADRNNMRLKISNIYSAWHPGKTLTVMFMTI